MDKCFRLTDLGCGRKMLAGHNGSSHRAVQIKYRQETLSANWSEGGEQKRLTFRQMITLRHLLRTTRPAILRTASSSAVVKSRMST
jgi:hypothetical protein